MGNPLKNNYNVNQLTSLSLRDKILKVMQEEHHYLPNTDRLSVLAASILLAYALLPFIQFPERSLSLEILGVVFPFSINFFTIISIISAGLAIAGVSWLLMDHPRFRKDMEQRPAVPVSAAAPVPAVQYAGIQSSASVRAVEQENRAADQPVNHKAGGFRLRSLFQHWMLPAMTAWVIGVPLSSLEVGMQWWAVFAFGGLLLVLVLIAEYIAVDPNDTLHGPAAIGLTAFSYALFLILIITLAGAQTRLYVLLPALTLAIFLVTLRSLYLRLSERWCFSWSIGISVVVAQVAMALHYWGLAPQQYSLIVLGLAYALASVAGSYEEGRSGTALWVEPALMLAVLWGLALALRGP